MTTKVHRLADALGRPLLLRLTAGQAGDITPAPDRLAGQGDDAVLADKALGRQGLARPRRQHGAEPVIPADRTRKMLIPHDATFYEQRHRIERCFNRRRTSAASPPATTGEPPTSPSPSAAPPP